VVTPELTQQNPFRAYSRLVQHRRQTKKLLNLNLAEKSQPKPRHDDILQQNETFFLTHNFRTELLALLSPQLLNLLQKPRETDAVP